MEKNAKSVQTVCEREDTPGEFVRRCFAQALMRLMKHAPIDKISITALCRTAGISRMTYYRIYEQKEQIFREYMKILVRDYSYLAGDGSLHRDEAHVLQAVRCFARNAEFVECLQKAGLEQILLGGITDYMLHTGEKCASFSEECTRCYYAGALYNVCMHWFCGGMAQDERTVTQAVLSAMKA